MNILIRISGLVEVPEKVRETLFRLGLRRKYSAILLASNERNSRILKKVRDYVAYGPIDNETLSLLIEKRAKPINSKKIDSKKIASEVEKQKEAKLKDFGIKPFFRLHPPRGGIDSKIHFPRKKGVLGDNKEKINLLVRRML